jgi:hypothetical protein
MFVSIIRSAASANCSWMRSGTAMYGDLEMVNVRIQRGIKDALLGGLSGEDQRARVSDVAQSPRLSFAESTARPLKRPERRGFLAMVRVADVAAILPVDMKVRLQRSLAELSSDISDQLAGVETERSQKVSVLFGVDLVGELVVGLAGFVVIATVV